MQSLFSKTEKVFNKIVDIQQLLANIFLIFIMTIITLDVLGRNIFNSPLKGTYEMTELGSALLVFFAFAITHRHGEHISIDFMMDRLSNKVQRLFDGVIEVVISILLFFMARHIFANGLRTMDRNTTTTDLAIPIYPILFVIAFTLIVFGLTALFKAIKQFRLAVHKE